ncbi:hypothetical protein GGTG_02836 [Gaeumannomyces tritici R3-111a-1]|uniref:Zn(2)-C6 fungal-type domain-containing protein n=1 Tax=Gaeumannomyces tritici (strain R3-111a-1) TaxID=644352 RepID=J3NNI0_GAET3|nr:hypothetical protein GGTG_02836 [Gaeumannomyces tritici R3-111a-1]EJT77731.1 hypothetical protein GGTG_02836 [Gaeumannomyces tritici R3-111a-1]
MSDYYHQFLSTMSGVGQLPVSSPHDPNPPQMHQAPPLGLGGLTGMPGSYQSLGYFTGFPDPIMFNSQAKASRSRRKSTPGLDHVKHRRTRSGCYTCRSRRVKCDETHPICERCRKGKRDCIYPPDAQGVKAGATTPKDTDADQPTSPTSSHDDDDDEDDGDTDSRLDTIPDEEEPGLGAPETQPFRTRAIPRRPRTASSLNLQRLAAAGGRQSSESPSLEGTRASSPSTSTGTAASTTPAAYQFQELPGFQRPEWAHLPHDVRFYLAYFTENITHYHYGMIIDSDDFLRTTLPAIAVKNEALLYALVGFSAYHFTLKNPRGRIQDFLQYYNKSVTLLLGFLKRKERHNIGTLLTILQLATIEEYLGDWLNLMGHQRAAYEVITFLYTPETSVETATSRIALTWYVRFDVFLSLMGGCATSMPDPWFISLMEHFHSQSIKDPTNMAYKIDDFAARLRFITREMSVLLGKHSASDISDESFAKEHARLARSLEALKEDWDPVLSDPAYMVMDLRAPPELDSVVDLSRAGVLHEGPLFPGTLLCCEWLAVVIVHECQAITRAHAPAGGDGGDGGDGDISTALGMHAKAICNMVEAIEMWPSSPKGSLVIIQACLSVAAPFVPRDEKHQQWIRRKFALLESMGYIFPLTTRTRMAELFNDEACVRWWLPNDEGFSPVLQAIRAFADERNATSVPTQRDNVPNIQKIFTKLRIEGGGGPLGAARGPGPPTGPDAGLGKGKGPGR